MVGLDPVLVVPAGVAPVGVEPVLVVPVGVELSVSGAGDVVPVSAASSAEEPQAVMASRASRPRWDEAEPGVSEHLHGAAVSPATAAGECGGTVAPACLRRRVPPEWHAVHVLARHEVGKLRVLGTPSVGTCLACYGAGGAHVHSPRLALSGSRCRPRGLGAERSRPRGVLLVRRRLTRVSGLRLRARGAGRHLEGVSRSPPGAATRCLVDFHHGGWTD